MQKPAPKQAAEAYKCKDAKYKLCGNPAANEKETNVFCIPNESGNAVCPITSLSFDNAGVISAATASSAGPPLINVQLSEGGAPCIYHQESFNSVGEEKVLFDLFPEKYYNKCQSVVFGSKSLSEYFGDSPSDVQKKTFTESALFTKIPSFKGTNEYNLIKENNQAVFKTLTDLPVEVFNVNKLKDYTLDMYGKSYREWDSEKCSYMNN